MQIVHYSTLIRSPRHPTLPTILPPSALPVLSSPSPLPSPSLQDPDGLASSVADGVQKLLMSLSLSRERISGAPDRTRTDNRSIGVSRTKFCCTGGSLMFHLVRVCVRSAHTHTHVCTHSTYSHTTFTQSSYPVLPTVLVSAPEEVEEERRQHSDTEGEKEGTTPGEGGSGEGSGENCGSTNQSCHVHEWYICGLVGIPGLKAPSLLPSSPSSPSSISPPPDLPKDQQRVSGSSQEEEEEEEERKSDRESIPPGDSSPPVNRNAEQQVCGHVSASLHSPVRHRTLVARGRVVEEPCLQAVHAVW